MSRFFLPPEGQAPLHANTLQKTFTAARTELALAEHASIHTLRHSYATPAPPVELSRAIPPVALHQRL